MSFCVGKKLLRDPWLRITPIPQSSDMELLYRIWLESNENGAMFFIRPNEDNIRRLFIGAKADCKELEPLIKDVFCNISTISYFNVFEYKFNQVKRNIKRFPVEKD